MFLLYTPIFFSIVSYLAYLLLHELFGIKDKIFISLSGFVFEQLILWVLLLIIYCIVKRKRLAVILTTMVYLMYLIATYIKVKILGVPIFPSDLVLIGDLLRTWYALIDYIPYVLISMAILVVVVYFEIRNKPREKVYSLAILSSIFLISYYFISIKNEEIRLLLRDQGIFFKKNVNLVKKGMQNGYMSSFVQAAFFIGKPSPPENYSKQNIIKLINQYQLDSYTGEHQTQVDNVIVLMIESFTDPAHFGWEIKPSPIPNFDKLKVNRHSGIAISPVYGGRSINAEFEIMTGLTNRFTPIETTPYQEFIDQEIPSLPRAFKMNGFQTNAIQMVHFKGFGYGKIYDYLQVDNKVSLSKKDYKPDPSGRSVASTELFKKIVSLTEEQEKSFIFAFPNSSHQPWLMEHYPDSKLNLINSSLTNNQKNKLIAYANSLSHIDLMLGMLMDHYASSDEKTLIFIVGDHQPSIDYYNLQLPIKTSSKNNFIKEKLRKYQTNFALWSNNVVEGGLPEEISMNLIPSLIIKHAGIKVRGLMKFNLLIRENFSVISHFFKEKGLGYEAKPSDQNKGLVEDYNLLQYDILFGENHAFKTLSE